MSQGVRKRTKPERGRVESTTTERPITRRKAAILRAATELFARRGFDGVSLDDVAVLAKTQRSLILYYYASKEELWKAAATAVIEEFNDEMRRRLASLEKLDDAEFREKSIDVWLSGWLDMPEVAQFLVREGGVPSARLNWLVEAVGVPAMHLEQIERHRRHSPIHRTCCLSISLALAALAPLLEAKMNAASGQLSSGISPLSKKNRDEVIAIFRRMADI